MERINTEGEAEEVHLKALLQTNGDTCEAEYVQLRAGAARQLRDGQRAEVVLADGRGRQVDPQLRRRAQYMRNEGIRVRPGPHVVGAFPGVARHSGFDAIDECIDPRPTPVPEQRGAIAEPAAIGRPIAGKHRRAHARQPPAIYFVDRECPRAGALHGDPGMHREVAAPAQCPRRIDLHHSLPRRGRIGREADGVAVGRAPVGRRLGARDTHEKQGRRHVSAQEGEYGEQPVRKRHLPTMRAPP